MITPSEGDLLKADTDAIVNAVNCVGVMGQGIALQFKTAYPDMFRDYVRACEAGTLRPGLMHVHDRGSDQRPRWIIHFPTKDHFRPPSRIEYIRDGLPQLVQTIRRLGIRSIAIPALGCGAGGLKWEDVEPLIWKALQPLEDVDIRLYAPGAGR